MAPGASNQKRKRDQTSNASGGASKRTATDKSELEGKNSTTNAPRTEDLTMDAKKRGRPAKDQDTEDENREVSRPLKRAKPSETDGRKSANQAAKLVKTTQLVDDETAESSTRRSKRDRRSADDNPWWASKTSEISPPTKLPKTQTNPPKKPEGSSGEKAGKPAKKPTQKRPPQEAAQPEAETETGTQPAKPPKPTKGQPEEATQPEEETGTSSRPSKHTKPSKYQPAEGVGVRRGARERRSGDETPWWASQTGGPPKDVPTEKTSSGPPKKVGPGRSSLGGMPVSETQNRTGQRSSQTKAPRSSSKDDSVPRRTAQVAKRPPSKADPRSSGASEANVTRRNRRSTDTAGGSQRRRQSDRGNESLTEPATAPVARYRHLVSRTRQIPRATISAKWSILDDASIAAVDSIISDASRPVLSRLRDRDQRHQQAQTILRTFAKRLHRKLVKGLPFPPPSTVTGRGSAAAGSHEMDLDFERTVDTIQTLEKTLEPLLHSVALLTAERDREEAALEREYKQLKSLEANARAEAKIWRERGKRVHLLAPEIREVEAIGGEEQPRVRSVKEALVGGVFKGLDGDLLALSQQIGSHMESMKGNLQQIDGVLPAIVNSRAALQGVLYRYLDPAQYDQVVLG